ncbi:hypothetical protein AVEN_65141-1 [Araneus ventricosus]|uniref:Uncharacterized protein n=1 Tax=Araneus ventricosus TaxID=182803 RepID=A0A4Y2AH35_ARAVE|nr:hypothetical protein AVEN_65141-1 [Araneus ventricosus]
MIWSNLRIAAPTIAIVCLACLSFKFSQKVIIIGLWFLATIAGKKSALSSVCEPDLFNLGLAYTEDPDVTFCGIIPAYAANCLALIKAFMSETSAKIAIPDSSPTPGIVNRS